MIKIIYIVLVISYVLACIGITRWLDNKKKLPNRWISGFISFLIILIPLLIFSNIPPLIMNILYLLCGLFAIMFFESSRLMVERGQHRGMIKQSTNKKNK